MTQNKNILAIPSNNDNELVALYKKTASLEVLAQLFNRYMDLLYAVCLKYLKEPETAKDAVMTIFEELVTKLKKHEVDNFKGWLYILAKNHCLIQIRQTRHLPTKELDDDRMQLIDDVHLNGVLEKESLLNGLEKCVENLSAEQKNVIQLFYLQGKCYQEITELTGMEWNTVRSMIQNGRRNLKICMENNVPESNVKDNEFRIKL
ncbi:MAG TPA: sigma-70 family RNA polymerase sigma factor [Puia sp.]|nr:sigma-70 family RNA polymerase sigma factor [Puia sp.]